MKLFKKRNKMRKIGDDLDPEIRFNLNDLILENIVNFKYYEDLEIENDQKHIKLNFKDEVLYAYYKSSGDKYLYDNRGFFSSELNKYYSYIKYLLVHQENVYIL